MPQMIRYGFLAGIMLAAGLLLAGAAHAGPGDCAAAIRNAVAHKGKAPVPPACWRVGPLSLGMSRQAAEEALGPADLTGNRSLTIRRRRTDLDTALYVFPRNLSNWLALAPAAREDFHPVTLRLAYRGDRLAALAFGRSARIDFPNCTPRGKSGPAYRRRGVDFPASFNGIGLDAGLKDVTAAFGRFTSRNRSGDFFTYWPVPIAITGADTVQEIGIADGMAAANVLGPAHLAAALEPNSCRINGYSLRN